MLTPKSGLLLGLSCVAAIAGVGCVFELSSGHPEWGSTATWGILVGSVPISIGAFFIAVKDARGNLGN